MKNSAIDDRLVGERGDRGPGGGEDLPDQEEPLQEEGQGDEGPDAAEPAGREKHDGLPRGDELKDGRNALDRRKHHPPVPLP